MPGLLEVIACSVADAVEAENGGAARIELVRNLERGGLTPPLSLVREVLSAVTIPVRVMLRETISHRVEGVDDRRRLHDMARTFAGLNLDGLVLGFLREGSVDLALTASILESAGGMRATFHHAFEEVADPLKAIADLRQIPRVDRILTHGGKGDWRAKSFRLRKYQEAASPGITVLAGGGIEVEVITELLSSTTVAEFHVGRAARVPPEPGGRVQRERVKSLVAALSYSP